jgi:NADH-quinone oxidoreductase subunit C
MPSVSSVYPAANWHERETFDMFGIRFSDHPNLKRILMWDDYPYFPLRKEFPLAGIDTPLPADDVVEVTQASVEPAPMMGGPFVSPSTGPVSDSEPRAKDESWTERNEKPL